MISKKKKKNTARIDGVACHYPPLKCTVFESYSRIFHPIQCLSPRKVLHTLRKVTGLPCYLHSLLSGHSFVVALLPMAPLLSLKPPSPPAPPGPSPGATPVLSGLSPGTSHGPYSPGASYLSPSCSLEGESLPLQLPSSLRLDGCCSPLAYGVPRLALGLSAPAPSHLTTCDHFPQSHSFTIRSFSLFLWEWLLHPGASRLAASCPPYPCPLGSYTQECAVAPAPSPELWSVSLLRDAFPPRALPHHLLERLLLFTWGWGI